jgi:hypothetical protein
MIVTHRKALTIKRVLCEIKQLGYIILKMEVKKI